MRIAYTTLVLAVLLTLAACGGSGSAAVSLDQVVESFQASGVEIGETREMTADDYGFAPMAEEGIRFLLPQLGGDNGGRIMRYDSQDDLERAKAYYDELGEQSAALFSHTFVRGDILVQVNGNLPQADADRLEEALSGL